MRILSSLIFLCTLLNADKQLEKVDADKIKPKSVKHIKTDGLQNIEIYSLDSMYFLVGYLGSEHASSSSYGPQLIVKDFKGDRVFASKPGGEGFVWPPVFFKSDDNIGPTVILWPDGMEQPNGCTAYTLTDKKVTELGYLPLAINLGYENAHIPKYTSVSYKDEKLIFSFNTEHLVWFVPDSTGIPKTKNLRGDQLRYIFDGEKFYYETL